eukprot:scaffold600_cov385-Prasinococcus_capsulatus_cf.AAC.2
MTERCSCGTPPRPAPLAAAQAGAAGAVPRDLGYARVLSHRVVRAQPLISLVSHSGRGVCDWGAHGTERKAYVCQPLKRRYLLTLAPMALRTGGGPRATLT